MDESRDGLDRPRTVEAWIEAARGGSRDVLGELLAAFRPYLWVVADGEFPTDPRARDEVANVVTDTLIDALLGFPKFRGRTEPEMRAWLRRILLRKLARRIPKLRERLREVSIDPSPSAGRLPIDLPDPGPSPSRRTRGKQRIDDVHRALARLPKRQRRVVELKEWHELSFAAIGGILGVSEQAAFKAWGRAIKRLGKDLDILRHKSSSFTP
jgi:RNA polymerase sigma-70 factor (subfamily 1)